MPAKYCAEDDDPTGERHNGMPTFPWGHAPRERYATRRQLRAKGLCPGGHPIAAQMIRRRKEQPPMVAWLYELDKAQPKRTPTLAQEEALDRAMAARQTCPVCLIRFEFCLPLKRLGSCVLCHDGTPYAAAA